MNANLPPDAAQWAAQVVGAGAVVENIRRLAGATSSTLYALDIVQGTNTLPCVLRRYDHADYLESEPDGPRHESAALQRASEAGLAVPEWIASDPDGAETGVPLLLMTRLRGSVELVPRDLDRWLHELAAALRPVHAVSADGFPWRFRPYADLPSLTPPAWSRIPELWEQAIALAQGPSPPVPECFIHRDFHPNNVLWRNGRLTGIVDWPAACRGAAQFDLAWCRHNLIYLHGIPAADRFLSVYQTLADPSFTYPPYWDVLALIEELPGPPRLYPPWAEFGIKSLTPEIMWERVDGYLEAILGKL